jgi:hypothetical protein
MQSHMNRVRAILAAAWRVMLGVFVLGQVMYLLVSLLFNVDEAFHPQLEIPWLHAWNEREDNGFRQYSQATAQRQPWHLFAPEAWREIKFLELQLRWDDPRWEPVALRGTCEPEDIDAFVHLGGFRFRKYEGSIAPEEINKNKSVLFGETEPEDYELPAELVYPDKAEKMLAYLRWRLAAFRREHPDRPPPSEVWLRLHTYRIPEPPGPDPWHWQDGGTEDVGRWLP